MGSLRALPQTVTHCFYLYPSIININNFNLAVTHISHK